MMRLDDIDDYDQQGYGRRETEGFDDPSEEDGWKTVEKKGKRGKNGMTLPKQAPSLQSELISATGQDSWFDEDTGTNNNLIPSDGIPSLPLWGESSRPPQQKKVQQVPSQFGRQFPSSGNHSIRPAVIHTTPTVYQVPNGIDPSQPVGPLPPAAHVQNGLNYWLSKFKFKLACNKCFTKNPEKEGYSAYHFYQWKGHICSKDLLICHLDSISESSDYWGLFRQRTNPNHYGKFQLCKHFQTENPCKPNGSCFFAHSEEEMELWNAEQDGLLNREDLLAHLRALEITGNAPQRAALTGYTPPSFHQQQRPIGPVNANPQASGSQQNFGIPHIPRGTSTPANQTYPKAPGSTGSAPSATFFAGPTPSPAAQTNPVPQTNTIPPFRLRLRVVCKVCSRHGPNFHEKENVNYCSVPDKHNWKEVDYLVCGSSGPWKRVQSRDVTLASHISPVMCKFAPTCSHEERTGKPCKFAHWDEEIELWNYQLRYNLPTIEKVIQNQRKVLSGQGDPRKVDTLKDRTVMTPRSALDRTEVNHTPPQSRNDSTPRDIPERTVWRHRDPPFVSSGNYKLCTYNLARNCQYSGVPDAFNFCNFAHSEEERKEWKQRWSLQQKNLTTRRQQQQRIDVSQQTWSTTPSHPSPYPKSPSSGQLPFTTSYVSEVPGSLNPPRPSSEVNRPTPQQRNVNPAVVRPSPSTPTVAPQLIPMVVSPGSGLTPENVKKLIVEKEIQGVPFNASYQHQWSFLVRASHLNILKNVVLLNGLQVRHFQLSHSESREGLVCHVTFLSTIPGFFQQRLFFDFGSDQFSIILFMTAVVGGPSPSLMNEPVTQQEESTTAHAPWTENNSMIVPYSKDSQPQPYEQKLMDTYPPPPARKIIFLEGEGLIPNSYKTYLHKLIQLEEKACNEKISKFCCSSELSLSSDLREDGVYQSALGGELFGKLKMGKGLTDNSDASQIVARMSQNVLLKFNLSSKLVYQSQIFYGDDNVLQQDDVIFIRIGEKCIKDEKLVAGQRVKVYVQFQVNRVKFCSMHYGVDNFRITELAFPPTGEPRFPRVRRVECHEMNPKQESTARYILGAGVRLPFQPGPVLVCGPFGTGKTHTVAKIAMRLFLESSSTKILITTLTNSAADWYITEHLHPMLERLSAHGGRHLVRVYATIVDPRRVDELILHRYTLLDDQGRFREPVVDDVASCRIVIATLSTAIQLVNLKQLHGCFSHIFIDEAGQALEPEVMIPLGLAGPNTVVVLAGDHKQMRPKVYSKECQERQFHRSMLERLVIWNRIKKCNLVQNLSYNYRMRPEILNFVSQFYSGLLMEPMGNHMSHPDICPISFYRVDGLEQQIGTSYVNDLEAQTIAILVKTLVEKRWPTEEWGEFDPTKVGVITPYRTQVKHIRHLLRQQKLGGITVERVQNVQGKQFRVVFISTVHTRTNLSSGAGGTFDSDQSDSLEENVYRGFLSDEGELITALTRSQSLLFVVGDPVALCTVGHCRQAWWRYLRECDHHNSLLPEETTLETIESDILASSSVTESSQTDSNVRQLNPYYRT